MKKKKIIKSNFNDLELEKVFTENCGLIAEARRKKLEEISEDIRKLEEFLKSACMPKNNEIFEFQKTSGVFLGWNGSKIIFVNDTGNKPLNSCKLEIRLFCKEILPMFLKECINIMSK